MSGAARKSRPPQFDPDDEITIERVVRISSDGETMPAGPVTTRMTKIDERLLAIARGELDPEDPFGGLIPIYDDERGDLDELDSEWLVLAPEPKGETSIFGNIVPRVCMRPDQLFALPLDEACSLFVSQVDGRRTLEEVIDACGLDELDGLEAIDDLLRHGAIVLG